jgi:hypothetical protein
MPLALHHDPVDLAALRILAPELDTVLKQIATGVATGTFEYRVAPEGLILSAGCARILGIDQEEIPGDDRMLDWLVARVHPEDLQPILEMAASLSSVGPSQRVVMRVQHHNGHWVRLECIVRAIAEAPVRFIGLVREWTVGMAHPAAASPATR